MAASFLRFQPFRAALPAVFVLAFLAASLPHSQAQWLSDTTGAARPQVYENFDVREIEGADATTTAALATVRATYKTRLLTGVRATSVAATARAMTAARTRLQAAIPTLQTEANRFGTAPEIVGTAGASAFLTRASAAPRETALRDFLAANAALYGVTASEAAALTKFADYANPAGNLSWVGLKQEINGFPVFQGEIQAAFTARGELARTTGNLAVGLDSVSLAVAAALSPSQAVAAASAALGRKLDPARLTLLTTGDGGRASTVLGGPYSRATKTELVYFPVEPGVATLAYSMVLWTPDRAYYLLVDAADGTLLWRKCITQDQTQTATYNVYTGVSPTPLTPSTVLPGQGTQPPNVPRVSVTLIADDLTASPLGWLTDGTNTTKGNNTTAGLDLNADDTVDSNVTGTGRVFSFAYNPAPGLAGAGGSTSPGDAAYSNGVVTNLFFWTNRYHDRLYQLGFTEAARNFQTTNTFTINGVAANRGGNPGDAILALAQYGSTTGNSNYFNNSNFSTPADGSPGTMRMFIFNNTSPNRDGSLDADVFIHEMTHGTSNRLHNNGSGLSGIQAGGMGEGWSDFYARCLLSRADEDVTGIFPSGGYVTYELSAGFHDNYYYGIREFPYAVKASVGANGKPYNPLTFGVIDMTQTNGQSNGAYPSSPVIGIYANEVHNIGHFWCTTLLEVRARMIQRLGWATGNQRALQIVTDAMKLDPVNPTILQARDSIIAADNAGFAGDDVPDIRSGFATRGVGAGATATGTTFLAVAESFYPASVAGAITFSDALGNNNGVADPGEDLVFTVPLTNKLTAADANVTATLGGTATANYGTLAAGGGAARTFSYHVPATAAAGTLVQIPFVVSSAGGVGNVTIPMRIGTPTVLTTLAQDFNSTAAGALPAGWTQTGTVTGSTWSVKTTVIDVGNSVFAADVNKASDSSLVSPATLLTSDYPYQLSFKQRYTTENSSQKGYDGGVLEISVNGGAFTDIVTAGGSWVQGGYGSQIAGDASGNALLGRRAWSGTVTTTQTVIANLPPGVMGGKTVQFRWRLGCDSSTASTGWSVDTVQLYSTLYASSPIDSDGDGIPNGWETAHGLNPNDPADGALDSDGDGVSNLAEYVAGTDPKNAADALKIATTVYDAQAGVTVTFPSVNGKTYTVDYTNDLASGSWTALQTGVIGTGGVMTVTDADAARLPERFYRARVKGQ